MGNGHPVLLSSWSNAESKARNSSPSLELGRGSPGIPFQHTFPVFQLEALGSTGNWTRSQPLVQSTDPR